MFKLKDGRDFMYQWDVDRQIIVDDPSITEVHFCNRTDECSLVVDVVDGLANVPNILLQSSFDIRVFGYDGKATLHDKKFKVNARTQPSDYMYTETVIKSVEEIMTAAEQVNTITTEFYEFVDEYKMVFVDDGEGNVELKAVSSGGGNVDLDDYYTKTETDEKIEEAVEAIDIPDITGKADKDHTHEQYLTEHQSLAGYATEAYVTNAITTAFAGIATAEGGSY